MSARGIGLQAAMALIAILAFASSAQATTVTIGSLAPASTSSGHACGSCIQFQKSTDPGSPSYVVPPGDWTITSWSSQAISSSPAVNRLLIFRPVAGTDQYMLIAETDDQSIPAGTNGPFATSIPVVGGDLLGVKTGSSGTNVGSYDSASLSDVVIGYGGTGAVGETCGAGGTYMCNTFAGSLMNVSATLFKPDPPSPPSNLFSIGKTERNKAKGTAVLLVSVPGPGEIDLTGKKVKPVARPAGHLYSKAVTAAGVVELPIKAKGKAKKKLRKKGKLKVKVSVTFTPTGGPPNTESAKVKLIKKPK